MFYFLLIGQVLGQFGLLIVPHIGLTISGALVAPRAGFLLIQCPKLLPVIHNNTPNKTGSSG